MIFRKCFDKYLIKTANRQGAAAGVLFGVSLLYVCIFIVFVSVYPYQENWFLLQYINLNNLYTINVCCRFHSILCLVSLDVSFVKTTKERFYVVYQLEFLFSLKFLIFLCHQKLWLCSVGYSVCFYLFYLYKYLYLISFLLIC